MAAASIKGPGILYVNSKLARTDILDEEGFMNWYDNDHIPEIMKTSGIDSARRWKDVDEKVDKPYLVTYPMTDLAFTQSEEFKKIAVYSKLLPGSGLIYDLADIDVRYYGLVQVFDPKGSKPGHTKCLITAAIDLGDEVTEEEFDKWYLTEHLDMISKVPGYLRTTRYRLLYYRTNAQSRELKGLPPREADIKIEAPPKWQALHEFDHADLDFEQLMATGETEWSKQILGSAKRMQTPVYGFVKGFGDQKFFHEQKMVSANDGPSVFYSEISNH